jgi:hypothetical protein
MTPKLSTVITCGTNTVRIYGKRSTKGWTVNEIKGASSERVGAEKEKGKAVQMALDCCDPNTHNAVFRVAPSD